MQVSKAVVGFIKAHDKVTIKGGVLDNKHVEDVLIKELSKLPGRDDLVAKVVSLIKGPLMGLVLGVSSPMSGLINSLNAIKNKK